MRSIWRNLSLLTCDDGRRVFADRMGATYADSGVAAPSLGELLGTDPDVVRELVTLRREDIGLGDQRSEEELDADLARAQAALEQLTAEADQATAYVVRVDAMRAELAQVRA